MFFLMLYIREQNHTLYGTYYANPMFPNIKKYSKEHKTLLCDTNCFQITNTSMLIMATTCWASHRVICKLLIL